MLKWFKKNIKESYFSNVFYELEESEEMHRILKQSRIDKQAAESLYGAMKVVYKNGVATKIVNIEEGEIEEEEIEDVRFTNKPISYRDYPVLKYRVLLASEKGLHQLGGTPPDSFKMPVNNTSTPYIYLGKLDCLNDELLGWTKLNVAHLVCPIFGDFELIYLDYSNPLQPKLVDNNTRDKIISNFEKLNADNQILFKELKVKASTPSLEKLINDKVLGNIGAPEWLQHELIPKCPKSGNYMKFLIQLNSTNLVELESSDVDKDEKYIEHLESFDFWGGGTLIVFYEPESKIMAYYIQNT